MQRAGAAACYRAGMRSFWVADLDGKGELHAEQAYDYASLETLPGCADLIGHLSGCLWREPEEFETTFTPDLGDFLFRWRASAPTAGIATLRCGGRLAAISLLATGLNPDADELTLTAFQRHLLRELHDTGIEPSFALLSIPHRPLVATINLYSPETDAQKMLVALMDRCFAASYFRYHRLV